jgi:hypothetical protein
MQYRGNPCELENRPTAFNYVAIFGDYELCTGKTNVWTSTSHNPTDLHSLLYTESFTVLEKQIRTLRLHFSLEMRVIFSKHSYSNFWPECSREA